MQRCVCRCWCASSHRERAKPPKNRATSVTLHIQRTPCHSYSNLCCQVFFQENNCLCRHLHRSASLISQSILDFSVTVNCRQPETKTENELQQTVITHPNSLFSTLCCITLKHLIHMLTTHHRTCAVVNREEFT